MNNNLKKNEIRKKKKKKPKSTFTNLSSKFEKILYNQFKTQWPIDSLTLDQNRTPWEKREEAPACAYGRERERQRERERGLG